MNSLRFYFPLSYQGIDLSARIKRYNNIIKKDGTDSFIILKQDTEELFKSMIQALLDYQEYIEPQKNIFVALAERHLRLSNYLKNNQPIN